MGYSLAADYATQRAYKIWDTAVPAALTMLGAYAGSRLMKEQPALGAIAGATAAGAIYLKMDRMRQDICDLFEQEANRG